MNDHNDEDLLALYQASRQEQPSEMVDRRIRRAAQNAIRRRRSPWIWGLSTAAVLVLSFSVVLQLYFDESMVDDFAELPQSVVEAPPTVPTPSSAPARKEVNKAQSAAEEVGGLSSGLPRAPAAQTQKKRMLEQEQFEMEPDAIAQERPVMCMSDYAPAPREKTITDSNAQLPAMDAAVTLPDLPTSEEALIALAPQLNAERGGSGLLSVYHNNKLILSVRPQAEFTTFKAWPGSERLGVEINWAMKPEGLRGCRDGVVYRSCQIAGGVTGYFEAQRLDHIQWQQPID